LSQTLLEEFTALPKPLAGEREGKEGNRKGEGREAKEGKVASS